MLDPRIVKEFDARAPFELKRATVLVLANIGSDSHGTKIPNTNPDSIDDTDYMMVVIPPVEFVLGTRRWEGMQFMVDELDVVVYSFDKFVRLLLNANPNVLGMLWLEPRFYVHYHPLWERFVGFDRHLFSTSKAYSSFIGYANGQMKKMTSFDLKTQQEWEHALDVITDLGWTKEQVITGAHREMPRADKNDYTGMYTFFGRSGETYHTTVVDAALNSIKSIHARHFQGYMGAKRKALVQQHGYDTKNAAHLIRLMRMCVEFLQTGGLQVYRKDDAQELIDIKLGKWSLDRVKDHAAQLFAEAKARYECVRLPAEVRQEAVDDVVVGMYLEALGIRA